MLRFSGEVGAMEPLELWKVARVAAHLDVTRKRVYTLIAEGRLEAMRLSRRGLRVTRRSVEAYVQEGLRRERRRREEAFA